MNKTDSIIKKAIKTCKKIDKGQDNSVIIYHKRWIEIISLLCMIICAVAAFYLRDTFSYWGWVIWGFSGIGLFTSIYLDIRDYVCLTDYGFLCHSKGRKYTRYRASDIKTVLVHRTPIGRIFDYGFVFLRTNEGFVYLGKLKKVGKIRAHWFIHHYNGGDEIVEPTEDTGETPDPDLDI